MYLKSTLAIALATLRLPVEAVWPIPKHYTHGNDVLWIDPGVQIKYRGPASVSSMCPTSFVFQAEQMRGICSVKHTSYSLNTAASIRYNPGSSTHLVQTAISNAYETIFFKNIVPWKFHPRNDEYEPNLGGKRISVKSVRIIQDGLDPPQLFKPVDGGLNESYSLDVSNDGLVTIGAVSAVGVSHALTTFSQLFYAHSQGGVYTDLAPISIRDSPVFPHRGLNLDVSRQFYPVSDIIRTVDTLAFNKLNRLHLHITDAQSWPLEVPTMPELASKGAYTAGATYSPGDLQQLQEHGAMRGVEVFIEIDMPGHTSSIWFSHPELIAAFNVQPGWDKYSAEPPSGTLKLDEPAVYDFLDTLWQDLLPRLAPYTSYFHTGGDEVNFMAYELDDTVRSKDPEVLRPLMQRFFDQTHNHVTGNGFTQIVWEEMLLKYNLSLPSDVVVQSWLSDASVAAIVKAGHKAIAGNYDYWYLDCGHGQWLNIAPGKPSQQNFPYLDYCSPMKNWRLVYSYDPSSGVPADSAHLVLGGEMSIWSEQTDAVNMDAVVWPRLSAAAEVLWSGAKDPQTGMNRSQVEAAPRLGEMRERLVARGVRASSIQMPFCQQDGSQCAMND